MRKFYFILFISLPLIYSCQNNEVDQLNKRVERLEYQNKILSDSIKKIEEWNLINSTIIGIPKQTEFKVNDEVEVTFGLFRTGEFRDHNIYEADSDFNRTKLLKEDWNEATFSYKYIPKSIDDNKVKLIFEYIYMMMSNMSYRVI